MTAQAEKRSCPRLFEAEAVRDGRLTGAEVARFEAHRSVCTACAHEVQVMQTLAASLRLPSQSAEADELHVRRERTRLLAAFDARLVPAPSAPYLKLWLAAAVLAVISLLAFVLRPSAPVATARMAVKVQADGSTKWSRHAAAEIETVRLESGTLSIHVEHALPHRRLLVVLPDGELEDIGTTFTVSAAAARTTHVSVQDGSVILRLHGAPPLTLRAGDSWSPAPAAVVATPLPNQGVRGQGSGVRGQPAEGSGKSEGYSLPPPARGITPAPSARPAPSVAEPESEPDPSADFRAAMAALNHGDNAQAAARFAAFLSGHPRDSRCEDAAYLRVLALQRAGDVKRMKQAATEYLARYPRGFRHAEVEPLSR